MLKWLFMLVVPALLASVLAFHYTEWWKETHPPHPPARVPMDTLPQQVMEIPRSTTGGSQRVVPMERVPSAPAGASPAVGQPRPKIALSLGSGSSPTEAVRTKQPEPSLEEAAEKALKKLETLRSATVQAHSATTSTVQELEDLIERIKRLNEEANSVAPGRRTEFVKQSASAEREAKALLKQHLQVLGDILREVETTASGVPTKRLPQEWLKIIGDLRADVGKLAVLHIPNSN